MSASTHEILTALARPFPADAVSWRVGQVSKGRDGEPAPTHGRALAYIDARDCEDRLDEIAGINWSSRHEIHVLTEAGKDQILCVCHISLLLETPSGWAWVTRSNGSGQTEYEGRKGAMSKAFVRAASAWGVGRFLYAIGSPRVKIQQFGKTWAIDKSEEPRLRGIVERAVKEFEDNPRMRPMVHEEPEPLGPVGKQERPANHVNFQPQAPSAAAAPPEIRMHPPASVTSPRLLAIKEATSCEVALSALSQARRDKTVDPVSAEQMFYAYVVTKASQATKPEHFVTLDGALGRASLAGPLTKQAREIVARARREKA